MVGDPDGIGARYNVKGYPWINFYKDGKAIQWKGRRYVPKLISFMHQRITQSFKLITDVNEATTLVVGGVEDVDVIMVAYFEEGSESFDVLAEMSDDYYKIKFVRVSDPEVAKAFGMSKKGVAIVRPAIPEVVTYLPGKVTKEAMISFFEDHGTPLIIDYNEDTAMLVFDNKQEWHITLFFPDVKTH